jgi:hypothetical protein
MRLASSPRPSTAPERSSRQFIAAGLLGYAAVLFTGIGVGHTHEFFAGANAVVAAAAIALALMALGRIPKRVRVIVVYVAWFGLASLVAVAAQLYQRVVPDASGAYVLIDGIAFGYAIASSIALLVAGGGLLRCNQLKATDL